ncbi:hypothetical protein ACQP1G_37155 [Nocardia sp. CA-107356]|uniref:hypothetical protein n=1 Tax=Nocardia sp. CA-107356 TaxID=3239972 RepID=UPI003D93666D
MNTKQETWASDTEKEYADVLQALEAHGYDAAMTNTGGGCLAITFKPLMTRTVLITDKEGPLELQRSDQTGWGVGVYNNLDEQKRYRDTDDCSIAGLLALLEEVKWLA